MSAEKITKLEEYKMKLPAIIVEMENKLEKYEYFDFCDAMGTVNEYLNIAIKKLKESQ